MPKPTRTIRRSDFRWTEISSNEGERTYAANVANGVLIRCLDVSDEVAGVNDMWLPTLQFIPDVVLVERFLEETFEADEEEGTEEETVQIREIELRYGEEDWPKLRKDGWSIVGRANDE